MKPINDFEDLYGITENGTIISFERQTIRNGGIYTQKQSVRKVHHDKNGYLNVVLCKDGKLYDRKVHRLIAEAFIPNPNNYNQINHKNGIKDDNRLENIEWCSASHNMKHRSTLGTWNQCGERNPYSKIRRLNKLKENV